MTAFGSVSTGVLWAGIFFVTAERYRFSPIRNLTLAALMGATYALCATRAGRIHRALGGRIGSRALLAAAVAVSAAAAFAPVLVPRVEAVLWAAAITTAGASAVLWPIVESYLGAGRHGARMRAAIGWFNVTWTPATALPLLLLPVLARIDLMWALGLAGVMSVAMLPVLLALPSRPAPHHGPEGDAETGAAAAAAPIGREYPWLLRSASFLLPLSYLLLATMSPVLPHRLREIGAGAGAGAVPESVVAATWMLARFVTLVAMWRLPFWHGRWGALAVAGATLAGGLALVLLAPTLAGVVAGLVVFGLGMGLTYYASLYYTLAVGHAAVDAGGNFEALIGVGYCVGPLLGIAGHTAASALAAPGRAASLTVTLAWTLAAAAGIAALRPYLGARRQRK